MTKKCPGDSALIRLFMDGSSARQTERLLGHLAICPRCSVRFKVLRELKRDLRPGVEAFAREHGEDQAGPLLSLAARRRMPAAEAGVSRPASRSGPFGLVLGIRFALGSLAVLAIVAGGAYLALNGLEKRSELRSPSARLSLLGPVGTLKSLPALFRWTPVQGAENYLLEVIDESLARIHVSSTFLINEIVLPADVRSRLVKGRTYVWTISARDGDSNLLASSSASFVIE